jgi:hypothetical protein
MVLQSSWSARHPVKVEIAGSSPVRTARYQALIAQRIERPVTNRKAAGSSPAKGARRSVAQRQSIGPTNRGAKVRVLPDRRRLWCRGSLGCELLGPGSLPGNRPMGGRRLSAWSHRSVKPDSPERRWFNSSFAHALGNGFAGVRPKDANSVRLRARVLTADPPKDAHAMDAEAFLAVIVVG